MKISFSPSSVPHWLSLLLLMAISCGKEIVKPTGNNKVVITVTNASDISYTTATLNSELTNVSGNTSISQHGHCWSTQSSPDISGTHTSLGALATGKTFNSGLTDLLSGTLYYVRPYIIMNTKVVYGNNISFTTTPTSHPTLTTLAVTNITRITAESGGNISSDGGSAVIARGVCWGTSVNPSLIGNHTSVGTGTGLFVSTLIGLSPATTYYIKAYATNSVGTAYGDQLDFITTSSASIPVVTTTSVTGITVSTATSGGNVTSSGGASVTAKGICWSINQTPSISDTQWINHSI